MINSLSIIILGVAIILMNLAIIRDARQTSARTNQRIDDLKPRQVCPSCGSTNIEDHPDRIPPRRCLDCGDRWVGLYWSTRP